MVIVTEDNVSKHILSFTKDNFLYTRTVCKVWYKNGKETNSMTNHLRAVESPSTFDEAMEDGFEDDELFETHLLATFNNSGLRVFQHLLNREFQFDQQDIEIAAEFNRVDVLRLYKTNGAVFDERVLHTAVRYGQLGVLEYLMGVGCPVDTKLIDWGFGDNVVKELKMRSLEIAARDGRIDIVKQLRTGMVNYEQRWRTPNPFGEHTFDAAIESGYPDMLKYLKDETGGQYGSDPYTLKFQQFVWKGDCERAEILLKNGLVDDFKGVIPVDLYMIKLLEKYGWRIRVEVVDNAIFEHKIALAKHIVQAYGINPTARAYWLVLARRAEDEVYFDVLNWLHDDLRVGKIKSDCDNQQLVRVLRFRSPELKNWFEDHDM